MRLTGGEALPKGALPPVEACVTILPYRDQDISLFAAVSAEMSDRLEAPVWTYDYHFVTMRADVWR